MISHSFTHVIRQYHSDIQTRINLKKALMPNTVPNPWHTYKPDVTVGHTLFRIADESRFKIHIWMHCSHWLQINERNIWPLKERKIFFFICHIHNYTEYNQQWNVFSAFNPSKCTHTWSSGQPTLRRPGSSWRFGALLKGLTSVVDNSCRSRDSNPQPRISSPTLFPLGHGCLFAIFNQISLTTEPIRSQLNFISIRGWSFFFWWVQPFITALIRHSFIFCSLPIYKTTMSFWYR